MRRLSLLISELANWGLLRDSLDRADAGPTAESFPRPVVLKTTN